MIHRTSLMVLLGLMCPIAAAPSAENPQATLEPNASYKARRGESVNYDIDFRVIVTAPFGTKKLQVWLPIPLDDHGQQINPGTISVFPANVKPQFHTEKVFGNRFAYFEIANPQGAQIISHSFKATVWDLFWDVDPSKVDRIEKWPSSFDPYRRAEKAIVVDERFTKLASEIASGKNNSALELDSIMTWVNSTMTYDHSNTSLIASSEHAFTRKRGDCSDYHGLCSSLGRALGVPTRVTYGLHLFPKNLPCHCKLEAFLPPYGWVSFDVSETQRMIEGINNLKEIDEKTRNQMITNASDRLRKGFRDNTWLMHSRGTEYDLAPPASQKVPLIATIYAEADGKPLPLPDPADPTKREFSWMTAHQYKADREVKYPFRDFQRIKDGK